MSALTKLFVVLLVVLSLLLSAASIVFVNTQSDFAKALDASRKTTSDLRTSKDQLEAKNTALEAQKAQELANKDTQINQAHNDLAAAQQQIGSRDGQIAELTATQAVVALAASSTGDALKAAQTAIAERTKSYDELRNTFDKQQKELVDTNLRVSDLTNTSDVNGRSLKVANEQIAQYQQDLAKANDVIRRNGLPPITDAGSVVNPEPAINVTARVQDTRMMSGVAWATINAGSADLIAKNMELKIIDPNRNEFLGYIVVDSVEDHLATGRLKGPGVSRIQKGSLVRSQL